MDSFQILPVKPQTASNKQSTEKSMSKQLKSVEIFLSLGIAASIGLTSAAIAETEIETNTIEVSENID